MSQFIRRLSLVLVSRRPSVLRAVCLIATALISAWRNVSPFDGASASVTDSLTHNMNDHDIYKQNWEPALPVANNTYVVEEEKLSVLGRHIQYLRPGEQFVILIANASAITLMPATYTSEAYDVEAGWCDTASRESYRRIFDRTPAGYLFWKVQDHTLKANAAADAHPAPPGTTGPSGDSSRGKKRPSQKGGRNGQQAAVKSLLFTAPSEGQMDDDDEEFCIIAQENKPQPQKSVSLIVVVNSTVGMSVVSGLAITATSAIAVLESLPVF